MMTSSFSLAGRFWRLAITGIMDNGGASVASKKKALALPTAEEIVDEFKEKRSSSGLMEIILAADRGNEEALSRLRVLYEAAPELAYTVSSWQYVVEREILGTTQPGVAETFAEQAERWRKKLAGDDPSPIESLLVNRIILDHLHALKSETRLQQKLNGSLTLMEADYYQKQAERAQRRLLRSIKTLAEVRKLLRPTVQVNIADKQVNVAGDVHTGAKETAA